MLEGDHLVRYKPTLYSLPVYSGGIAMQAKGVLLGFLYAVGALFGLIIVSTIMVSIIDPTPAPNAPATHSGSFVLDPGDTQLVSSNMAQMPGDILGSRLHLQIDQSSPAVVGLTIKNGDIVCGNSDDIYVQFDGGPNETYTCRETQEAQESLSNGPIYIDGADQLVTEARKASSMAISPQIVGKGRVTFMFGTSGGN